MSDWPAPVAEQALHGPAGEFVLRTEPHSEAHPMALLVQFLLAFGCACGRGAHYQVEADRHYPNEFAVLVGPSARGRKGSAWGHVQRLLQDVDQTFTRCVVGGLSSGEGLIAQVRDPVAGEHPPASADKRRLVVEPEFAQVLKVLARGATRCLRSSGRPGTASRCRRSCAATHYAPPARTSRSSATSPAMSCSAT